VSAYYAPAFVYGGPPRSIHGLCHALHARGLDLTVFTTDANGAGALPPSVTAGSRYEGVAVRYFPRSRPRILFGSRTLESALGAELPSASVVHIHGLWNRVVWSAARAANRAGVPYVLSPRGMLEPAALAHHAWRKRIALALFDRRVLDGAALVHATSPREAGTVAAWVPHTRVVTIPNGIDPAGPPVLSRAELGLPEGVPIVSFIARLHAIKRPDLVVDALVRMRAAHPQAHLVIAGPDEHGLWPGLVARAGEARGSVSWIGPVDRQQRDSLLGHAAALVMCSDSESFGMSVLEAMAAGTPVVVTDTCGWDEVARYGSGLVVEQDAAAIARALATLLDDPPAARAMGERGRARAVEFYGWDAIAASFEAEYRALVPVSRAAVPAS